MTCRYSNFEFVKSSSITVADSEIEEMKNCNEVDYASMTNDDDVARDLIDEVNKVLIAETNLSHDVMKITKQSNLEKSKTNQSMLAKESMLKTSNSKDSIIEN